MAGVRLKISKLKERGGGKDSYSHKGALRMRRITFTDTDTGLPHTYRDFAQPLGVIVPNELPELPPVPTTLDNQKKWKVTIGFQAGFPCIGQSLIRRKWPSC